MHIITHTVATGLVAEFVSQDIIINTIAEGIDLVGTLYYQGFEGAIIHRDTITPDFFDLKTKIAGEILQKFSNYRIRLAIVGNFESTSKSLKDFIYECNKGRQVNFVTSVPLALERLFK